MIPKSKTDSLNNDQEILRELSNLNPKECLRRIAETLRLRLRCETACILLWHEVWSKNEREWHEVLVTEVDDGMPEELDKPEIYSFGEGITGGYLFEQEQSFYGTVSLDKSDLKKSTITDSKTGLIIKAQGTNWSNMAKFAEKSAKRGFKSLLGMPLYVKGQKIGVVKLINKLADNSDQLAENGFTQADLDRVKTFLSTIEMVVEAKGNEKQIENLLAISEKILGADFDYKDLLEEIALRCANALNLRLCLIRLLENNQLKIYAGSSKIKENKAFDKLDILTHVIKEEATIKGNKNGFEILKKTKGDKDSDEVLVKSERHTWPDLPTTFEAYGENRSITSFLVVPIVYQGKVIGDMECYTFLPHEFSTQEIDTIKIYGSSLVTTLFQRNRIEKAFSSLSESFGLHSSSEAIYEHVIDLVERYLDTKMVSVWGKRAEGDEYKFTLLNASKEFHDEYEKAGIEDISRTSLTAKMAKENDILHLSQQDLQDSELEHKAFIDKLGIKSMTIVPISMGQQVNAVLDIFYDYNKILFKEERGFLGLLAGRTATAIWNKEIAGAFKAVSDLLLSEQDIEEILKEIARIAREVLYADLVILFYYDSAQAGFLLPPKWSGPILSSGIYKVAAVKKSDLVSLILRHKSSIIYLENEAHYKKFCKDQHKRWREEGFWHRENICSLAAIRLEDKMKKPIGVMFINYRAQMKFDAVSKRVIELFTFQAASALANARFRRIQGYNLLGLSSEGMIADLLSDNADLINSIDGLLTRLRNYLKPDRAFSPAKNIKRTIELLGNVLKQCRGLLKRLRDYRQLFSSDSRYAYHTINELINNVLEVISSSHKYSGINHSITYGEIPLLYCDRMQIQSMIYQMFSALLDEVTAKKVVLKIETMYDEESRKIAILANLSGEEITDATVKRIIAKSAPRDARPPHRISLCREIARLYYGDIVISKPGESQLSAIVSLQVIEKA